MWHLIFFDQSFRSSRRGYRRSPSTKMYPLLHLLRTLRGGLSLSCVPFIAVQRLLPSIFVFLGTNSLMINWIDNHKFKIKKIDNHT